MKTAKPGPYPADPATLGDHLRKRRHELGLLQRQVARKLRVTLNTVIDWEKDRVEPELRYWPNIISFLGYDPYPEPRTLGEKLRSQYRALGIARKEAAARLGMDENTLQRYETGIWSPKSDRARRLIKKFLEDR